MTEKTYCIRVSKDLHNQIKSHGILGQTYSDVIQGILNELNTGSETDILNEDTKKRLDEYRIDDQSYDGVVNNVIDLNKAFNK